MLLSFYTIFKMEQFLKLPQIRISILEKIVSERRKKVQTNNKFSTARLQPGLINGQKPFYKFLNDNRSNCTCLHLRCNCKIKSHHHGDKKYPFLLRRQKRSEILADGKKQQSYGESQLVRKNKQFRKDKSLSKQAQDELIYKDKINKLYEKIEKKLHRKLIQLKKSNIEKERFKKQVIKYMMKKYNKTWKNPSIDELTVREQDQLVKQVQRFVINNQKLLGQKQPKDNQNLNQHSLNDQNERKKLKKNRTEISLKMNQGKKGKKKKNSKRLQKKSQKQKLLSMIIKNDKKQNEEFINLILNYDLKIFRQKIAKIQQILEEYSYEQSIKNNILQTVSNLKTKIKESQLDYESIQNKLKCIQKILRFKMDQNIDIQYLGDQDQQFDDNRLTSTLLKSRKTIKSIKKSLKSQKSVRSLAADDQINMVSAFSIKTETEVSLGQVFDINRSISQLDYEEQQKTNFSNYEIKINPPSIRECKDNINQKPQQKQPKTQKIVMQHNQEYFKAKAQKKKTKKHYSQENEFDLKSLISPQKKNQNKQNEKEQRKASSSTFKRQYSMEMRKLRQNLILEENKIKQFMQYNKQTVVKGMSRLKDENLQMFIIEATDSLLTKKKKIRKLKQLASKGVIKVDLISQILAYINLYEIQSNLILRRKIFQSQNLPQNETQPEFSLESLIDKGRLFEDLKFISLNKNYCYGEIEQEQNYNKKVSNGPCCMGGITQICINSEGKDLNNDQKKQLYGLFRNQMGNELIQKQMGYQGRLEVINLLEDDRETKRKEIRKKSTKLGKKFRKLAQQSEQQASFLKKNRFLLTQNTLIL